jgi:hypothetical protein
VPPAADNPSITTPDAAPVITLQPQGQTVTEPAPATFQVTATGTPAPTYQWSVNGNRVAGATGATYVTPATAFAQNGSSYTVEVANGVGATVVSSPAVLTVLPAQATQTAPVITVQPQDQTVTAPAPATFQVTATGTPAPTYQWSVNGNPIAGATGATYVTPATAVTQNGSSYTVQVGNGVGAALVSSPAVLNVLAGQSTQAAPVITVQPASVVVAPLASATFTVTATGNPAVQYQWRQGGVDITGANAASYTTGAVSPADDGTSYTVAVSNGIGAEVVSNPAILLVGQAPAITTQPAPRTAIAPATATFTVAATGHPLAYQWQDETGANIPGATSAFYTTPATTVAFNGKSYRVVVSGFGGTVTSNPASLSVSAAATIITQPVGQAIALGAPLNLSVVAAGAPASFSYQWFLNDYPISGASSASYTKTAALTDTGTYFVQVSNGTGGLVQSISVPVTVTQVQTVSGVVTMLSGAPAAGLTVSIDTNPPASTTTDGNGNYSLPAVPAGTWTITPSAPGFSSLFFPATAHVTVTNANLYYNFQANLGYTVAGRLTYQGTRTGPVYLTLVDANGGQTLGTTAVTGEVNYSIRGVPPGTYTLNAAMDISGGTLRTVNDPSGTRAAVTVVAADLAGQDLTLADPAPAPLTGRAGPATLTMSPMDSGAVAVFPSLTPAGLEQAAQYILEWNAAADFSSPIGDSMAVQPRRPRNVVFIGPEHGLVNGQVYYFRVHAAAGGTVSNDTPTPAAGPIAITIGARPESAGTFTVSGSVNFTGEATGPLYVGLLDRSNRLTADQAYIAMVQNPGNDQVFAVSGVPQGDGGYTLMGFIDQNGSGRNEAGDLSVAPLNNLAVDGNIDGQELDFYRGDSQASVGTIHAQTNGANDAYRLLFRVRDQNKHVISATLTAGPNVMAPMDLASPNVGQRLDATINLGVEPTVGDVYALEVNYSDGTSDVQHPYVTEVLDGDAFATNPVAGANNVTPQFSWVAPVAPPANYDYLFSLQEVGGPVLRKVTRQTPLYNWPTDLNVAQPLVVGTAYLWTVTVRDNQDDAGNQTEMITSYVP